MATKKGKKGGTKKAKKVTAKKGRATASRSRSRAKPAASRSAKKVVARKPAGKRPAKRSKRASATRATAAAPKPVRRYDRAGHLDPHYAAGLRNQSAPLDPEPRAFLERPRSKTDDLAEERGEEVIEKATTGEDEAEEMLDQVVPEETGGPFVETNAAQEFAHDTDASNPKGAKREPFPTT